MGCSQAGKWPPASASLKYTRLGKARRAHVSGARKRSSSGKAVMATGIVISSVLWAAALIRFSLRFSQYRRAAETAVFVSQYRREVVEHLVSRRRLGRDPCRSSSARTRRARA